MRIAVVSAPSRRQTPPDYVKALAKGMELMGHTIELIDAWTDSGMRLPGCDYIAIITTPASFFSAKIPDIVPKILSAGSGVSGKKSAAFVKREGLRSGRTMVNLMKAMEKEGMLVNWSETLFNAPHAQEMGKRIGA
jgi:hypothetical protein